ncbi:MAG: hypothetical protein IPK22_07565 [Verrucomicrobiaceae bacterium]|nr:hypothetical protein [Verrucomicrobiaceae bacterium]
MTASSDSFLSQMLAALRANDGLMVGIVLCVALPLVLGFVGLIMRAAGVSLRPILFMAVLMLPMALVFLIGQLVQARVPVAETQKSPGLELRDGRLADREELFGADVDPKLIREARSSLPGILDEAEAAEAAVTLSGETMLVAQFPDDAAAKRAAAAYHRGFQLHGTSGDETHGWRAKRGLQGDFIEMLRTGRVLLVWTGLTREACSARRAATRLDLHFPAITPPPPAPLLPALQPLAAVFAPLPAKLAGSVLMLVFYVGWFFKGAAWAASAPPAAGTVPVSRQELVSRLMAVNDLDVPFTITNGERPGQFIADWRYADAKWVDHARAHGLRRSFRLRLSLDEPGRVVRITDYSSTCDWSAGPRGASLDWKASTGIVFFQVERQSVFGLQLDEHGRFKPELAYTYTFNLDEMKSPLREAVTRSGWTWRPTVWQGPSWLRWLTE